MSVKFRLHKNTSVGTKMSGKWYARMVPTGLCSTKQLASIIQQNCSMKKSDVLAVLDEMVEVMTQQMQAGNRVKLDGFGSFKIGLNCKGATSAEEFTVKKNIKGTHVVFTPERSTDSAGNKTKQFLQGVVVEELPINTVVREEEEGD